MRYCHDSWGSTLLSRLRTALVSRRHCVMYIAEVDTSNKTQQQYVGFAHIAISDVIIDMESSSWYHIPFGGVDFETWLHFFQIVAKRDKRLETDLTTDLKRRLLVFRCLSIGFRLAGIWMRIWRVGNTFHECSYPCFFNSKFYAKGWLSAQLLLKPRVATKQRRWLAVVILTAALVKRAIWVWRILLTVIATLAFYVLLTNCGDVW